LDGRRDIPNVIYAVLQIAIAPKIFLLIKKYELRISNYIKCLKHAIISQEFNLYPPETYKDKMVNVLLGNIFVYPTNHVKVKKLSS
jgi:hypothetical protein